MKVSVITPVFEPTPSGASAYTKLLAEHLMSVGAHVNIYTEAHPLREENYHKYNVIGLFPYNASATRHKLIKSLVWLWQNIKYLHLLQLTADSDHVIIHSSFFKRPSFMLLLIFLSKAKKSLDIRDLSMSEGIFRIISHKFNSIIYCNKNAEKRFNLLKHDQIHYMPVPIDIKFEKRHKPKSLNHNIKIVVIGDVSKNKGVELLTRAILPNHLSIHLIGATKDPILASELSRIENIHVHGTLNQHHIMCHFEDTDIILSLSKSEGVPRSILEALSFGIEVLCRRGIPEMEEVLDIFVEDHDTLYDVIEKVELVHQRGNNSLNYDLERHNKSHVFKELVV